MEWLRVQDTARRLGLKVSAIRELDRRGLLKARRSWSGQRLFLDSEVEALAERLRNDGFRANGQSEK